jgi:hypothetical protein
MLQELCQLATREKLIGDTAFEVRPIAWIINLKANGDFISMSGTHEPEPVPEPKKGAKPKKPKEVAKKFTIPRQFNPDTGGTRTSGDYAYFLVDRATMCWAALWRQRPTNRPRTPNSSTATSSLSAR